MAQSRWPWIELVFAALLVLCLGSFIWVRAEDPPAPRCVVEPTAPMSNRILFVLDRSGSMAWGGNNLQTARDEIKKLIKQPLDDLWVGIIAFDHDPVRWAGIPEEGVVPRGWAALPSAEADKQASEFLDSFAANGGTRVVPALTAAFSDSTKVKSHLTIVLVTDGAFDECTSILVWADHERYAGRRKPPLWSYVRPLAETREKAGLAPAQVWILGVESGDQNEDLKELASKTGGGFYIVKELPKKEEGTDGSH